MNPHSYHLSPTRITRSTFLVRGLLLMLGGFVASVALGSSGHAPLLVKVVLIGGGVTLIVLLFIALFRLILIPRLRDIGLHPAWSLLILVHSFDFLFLLALLFIPSNAFAKRSYAAWDRLERW